MKSFRTGESAYKNDYGRKTDRKTTGRAECVKRKGYKKLCNRKATEQIPKMQAEVMAEKTKAQPDAPAGTKL